MKVIVEEADKMERLVKDMLDLAKLESGTLKLRKTTFILSELVEEVVDKLFHLLKEKQLEVVIIPANELPIHADIGWMEQVIINFVVNAIRHAEEGSSITIRIEGSGEVNTFSIENKGDHPRRSVGADMESFLPGRALPQPPDRWDRTRAIDR